MGGNRRYVMDSMIYWVRVVLLVDFWYAWYPYITTIMASLHKCSGGCIFLHPPPSCHERMPIPHEISAVVPTHRQSSYTSEACANFFHEILRIYNRWSSSVG